VSTARVDFTRSAADRIARAVRVIERGNRDESPLDLGFVETPAKVFRMARFTGDWAINTFKEVEFWNSTATIRANNVFVTITVATATSTATTAAIPRPCAIAKDGSAWYLIAARC
jgi:hypothetical protein